MGFLTKSRPKAEAEVWLDKYFTDIYGGRSTTSGVNVSSDTAMRLITAHSCVKVLSETVKQLPLHVMEEKDGKKTKAKDFYLYELLHHQPNSWMTAPEFWSMAEAHFALRGNFIAYKAQIAPDRPIKQLIPIQPRLIHKVTQNKDYSLDYEIHFPDEEVKHLSSKQVFHIRGIVLNGYMGVNPIEDVRETLGIDLAGEKFLGQYFGKGLHPGAVIKHPLSLGVPAYKKRREEFKEKYQGLGKSHEFMLIDENMDVVFPEIKLVDAQFLELMKMTEAQICGLFRVPLMLIQSGNQAPTYASAEQFMLSYVVHSLNPILVNIEAAIRRDLLTPEERKKYYAKFNVDALLRGDYKTRMEGFQVGVNTEIICPNEARGLLDLNPYDGGEVYRTRTSTIKESDKTKDEPKKADEK